MQLLSLLPLALAPLSDRVTLTPKLEDGVTLRRTIVQRAETTGGDLTVEMDGQEVPSEFLPDLSLEVRTTRSLTLRDAKERGLVRAFEALEATTCVEVGMGGYMGQEDTASEATAASPLAGRAVRFADDAAVFVDDAGRPVEADPNDRALLEGLAVGLDLAAWWPLKPVAVGDSWAAPADAFGELLDPSGDLAWRWTAPEAEHRADTRTLTGEVTLTLAGVREVAGRSVAEVTLAGALERVEVAATELENVPVAEGTATETRTAAMTLSGTLTLDIAGGHLATARVTAEVTEALVTVKDPGQPGPEYRSRLTFRGRETYDVAVARE